jgi:hypothetical protein
MKKRSLAQSASFPRHLCVGIALVLLLGTLLGLFLASSASRADDPPAGPEGAPLGLMTIAQARSQGSGTVTEQGIVTVADWSYNTGFASQDGTAGIYVYPSSFVDVSQGDTEIQFFETEQIQVLQPGCVPPSSLSLNGPVPLRLSTGAAGLEENEGRLVQVWGEVTAKEGSDTMWVDDGSGPVRAFLDGYNGYWEDGVSVGQWVRVAGLASEDGLGRRLRVRNHGMHPALPDDLQITLPPQYIYLPSILEGYVAPGP